jgi:hypothetical protein
MIHSPEIREASTTESVENPGVHSLERRETLKIRWVFAALLLGSLFCGSARAQVVFNISVDEFGHGVGTLGSFFSTDPGPGGQPGVLTYVLPFVGVQGDVLIQDGVGGPVLDIIRFNGNGTLIFYSDTPPADAPADTPFPPSVLYTNTATIVETGAEGGFQFALYAPTANQPGFGVNPATGAPVNYTFISDIPEPSQLALAGVVGAIAFAGRFAAGRFKKKS